MDLKVVEHRTAASARSTLDAWRELHADSGTDNPFTGPDWVLPWLEAFGHDPRHEPRVLELRDGARLVGVAPLFRRTVLGGLGTVVQPVGTGAPWIGPFEQPAVVAAAGHGRDVARAVVEHLCARPQTWDVLHLSLGSTAPWLEPEWLPDWSFTLLERRVRASAVVPLAGVENVYAGRRNLKESLRRARNRLTRDFGADGWSVRRAEGTADVLAAFDRVVALHGERARLRDGRPVHADVFADRRVLEYLRTVVGRAAGHGGASVYELWIGEESVAGQLVLHTSTASYSSTSGVAERAWPYSAVTYLLSQVVADAQEAGRTLLNLSTGPNQAKLRWTDQVRVVPEFAIVGPRRRSQLLNLGLDSFAVVNRFQEARRAHRV